MDPKLSEASGKKELVIPQLWIKLIIFLSAITGTLQICHSPVSSPRSCLRSRLTDRSIHGGCWRWHPQQPCEGSEWDSWLLSRRRWSDQQSHGGWGSVVAATWDLGSAVTPQKLPRLQLWGSLLTMEILDWPVLFPPPSLCKTALICITVSSRKFKFWTFTKQGSTYPLRAMGIQWKVMGIKCSPSLSPHWTAVHILLAVYIFKCNTASPCNYSSSSGSTFQQGSCSEHSVASTRSKIRVFLSLPSSFSI